MAMEETPTKETVTPAAPGANWKTRAYLIGAAIGLLLGLLSAYLYVRASEEDINQSGAKKVKTGDAMKLTLSVLGLVRQIAELGSK
jgi:hypothetical protein